MLDMHPQTLRKYERLGLVRPARTIGSMRLYSRDEIERLRFIKRLVDDVGINLAGVQQLLESGGGDAADPAADPAAALQRDASAPAAGARNGPARDAAGLDHEATDRIASRSSLSGDGIQGLLRDAGRREDGLRQGDQAGVPQAGAQVPPGREPGRQGGRGRFKEINEANEVLGDPEKRKKYDELGANWRRTSRRSPGGRSAAAGWRGAVRRRRRRLPHDDREEMAEMFGGGSGDSPFSDFFTTFFGGGGQESTGARGGRARPRNRKGRDVEHEIELDLEDALRGSVQRLGCGTTASAHRRGADPGGRHRRLARPRGRRRRPRHRQRRERRSVPARAAAAASAVRAKGRDLYTKVRVPVTTAVLGGEVDVLTLEGKSLRLKMPPGTQNGQVFRLRGHGLPAVGKPDERGDLYATVDVDVPQTL